MKKSMYVLAVLLIIFGIIMVGYSVIITPPQDPYLTDPTIPDQPKEPEQTPPSPKQPEQTPPTVTQ